MNDNLLHAVNCIKNPSPIATLIICRIIQGIKSDQSENKLRICSCHLQIFS